MSLFQAYDQIGQVLNTVFSNVKDIHDVLEITVYDEDKDHQYEFLGKIMVPLMKIRNNDRKWYSLKDKKMRSHAKGDHPRILLEMFFVYNKVRASVRTFNPKQVHSFESQVALTISLLFLDRNG